MNLSPLRLEKQLPLEQQLTVPPGNQLPNVSHHHQESLTSNLQWSRNAQIGSKSTGQEPFKKGRRVSRSSHFSPPRKKGLMSSKPLLDRISPSSTSMTSRWQQPLREEDQGQAGQGVIARPLVHQVQGLAPPQDHSQSTPMQQLGKRKRSTSLIFRESSETTYSEQNSNLNFVPHSNYSKCGRLT